MQKRGWFGLFVLCFGASVSGYAVAQDADSSVKTLESIVKDIPLPDPMAQHKQAPEHEVLESPPDPTGSDNSFVPSDAFPDAESTGQVDNSILPEGLLTPPEVEKTPPPQIVPENVFSKARLIFLEKRNGKSQKLDLKIGDKTTVQGLTILVHTCKRKTIEAGYPLTASFVEITPLSSAESAEKRLSLGNHTAESVLGNDAKTFSGWMFAEHPSKTVFDHPLYDVWLSGCSESINSAPEAGEGEKKSPSPLVPAVPVPSSDAEEE